jgi:hypothetical protein
VWTDFIRHCDTDMDHRLTLMEWMECVVGNARQKHGAQWSDGATNEQKLAGCTGKVDALCGHESLRKYLEGLYTTLAFFPD